MENREIIQCSIDYIEENLKAEITADELANSAGFSLFHYYRLFQSVAGIPVMQYIVRRKLQNAIYEISCGSKIIDAALEYGFGTHAGFYKAFRREFGYAPSEFLKKHKVKKPYKINLLQEEHSLITHKKIAKVLKHWDLENESVTDIYYEGSGNRNDSAYYIGGKHVLKLASDFGKLKNHIALSKSLETVGLSAATPVKTKDGGEYVRDGELYFFLTRRLAGSQMVAGDMFLGDFRAKANFVGEIIGQLHLALKAVDVTVNDVNLYQSVKNWAMPKVKELMNLPDSLCNDYTDTFGKLYDKLPKQIIHRDPNPGNIIFNNDKWGFIDFELSEKNIRLFDPCYAATAILSEAENDSGRLEAWIKIYKNIIYGYDSVARLSEDEFKAVPYVILSNQLICVAWFSEQDKYKDVYDINKKMTKQIIEVFDNLKFDSPLIS